MAGVDVSGDEIVGGDVDKYGFGAFGFEPSLEFFDEGVGDALASEGFGDVEQLEFAVACKACCELSGGVAGELVVDGCD